MNPESDGLMTDMKRKNFVAETKKGSSRSYCPFCDFRKGNAN